MTASSPNSSSNLLRNNWLTNFIEQIRYTEIDKNGYLSNKGIELLKNAQADQSVLTLKSYETLAKMADGRSTKIIVPSSLQDITSIGTVLKETMKDDRKH